MTSVDAAQDHIHSISSRRSSIHLAIPPSFLLFSSSASPPHTTILAPYTPSPFPRREHLAAEGLVHTHLPSGTAAASRLALHLLCLSS
ncbi:hypothetical protein CHARACLAT_017753 [Characodon lateralis]|uniref:Uncharacterized protein n=1 Tax=Characodon lateralis TaxID=208331 RepID=A0ABU7DS01_9TELE|nr:hypothetical protein [Characodon lateralis]